MSHSHEEKKPALLLVSLDGYKVFNKAIPPNRSVKSFKQEESVISLVKEIIPYAIKVKASKIILADTSYRCVWDGVYRSVSIARGELLNGLHHIKKMIQSKHDIEVEINLSMLEDIYSNSPTGTTAKKIFDITGSFDSKAENLPDYPAEYKQASLLLPRINSHFASYITPILSFYLLYHKTRQENLNYTIHSLHHEHCSIYYPDWFYQNNTTVLLPIFPSDCHIHFRNIRGFQDLITEEDDKDDPCYRQTLIALTHALLSANNTWTLQNITNIIVGVIKNRDKKSDSTNRTENQKQLLNLYIEKFKEFNIFELREIIKILEESSLQAKEIMQFDHLIQLAKMTYDITLFPFVSHKHAIVDLKDLCFSSLVPLIQEYKNKISVLNPYQIISKASLPPELKDQKLFLLNNFIAFLKGYAQRRINLFNSALDLPIDINAMIMDYLSSDVHDNVLMQYFLSARKNPRRFFDSIASHQLNDFFDKDFIKEFLMCYKDFANQYHTLYYSKLIYPDITIIAEYYFNCRLKYNTVINRLSSTENQTSEKNSPTSELKSLLKNIFQHIDQTYSSLITKKADLHAINQAKYFPDLLDYLTHLFTTLNKFISPELHRQSQLIVIEKFLKSIIHFLSQWLPKEEKIIALCNELLDFMDAKSHKLLLVPLQNTVTIDWTKTQLLYAARDNEEKAPAFEDNLKKFSHYLIQHKICHSHDIRENKLGGFETTQAIADAIDKKIAIGLKRTSTKEFKSIVEKIKSFPLIKINDAKILDNHSFFGTTKPQCSTNETQVNEQNIIRSQIISTVFSTLMDKDSEKTIETLLTELQNNLAELVIPAKFISLEKFRAELLSEIKKNLLPTELSSELIRKAG